MKRNLLLICLILSFVALFVAGCNASAPKQAPVLIVGNTTQQNGTGNATTGATGNNGTQTGNNGTQTGNNGTQTGNNGTQTGNTGTQTGNTGTQTGNTGTGTGTGQGNGCQSCGPGQICQNNQCVNLPAKCPCPKNSYCDLGTNTCKPGCVANSDCPATTPQCDATHRVCVNCLVNNQCAVGHICVQNHCQAGCDSDNNCAGGQVCDQGQCRTGCRGNSGCGGSTPFCGPSRTCVACLQDTDCSRGQICDQGQCHAGCRHPCQSDCQGSSQCADATPYCGPNSMCVECVENVDCPTDQHCDATTHTCMAGCAPTGASSPGNDNCDPGQACAPVNCTPGAAGCKWACSTHCVKAGSCHTISGSTTKFKCVFWPGDSVGTCRFPCVSNSDCPDVCAEFDVAGGSGTVRSSFCARRCQSGDCTHSIGEFVGCSCNSSLGICEDPNSHECSYEKGSPL